MGYVEQTLIDGEKIVGKAEFHWLYTFGAIFYILLGFVFIPFTLIFTLCGIVMLIKKWTTEIAITNKRLVYKRGWIARKTDEIGTKKLEEVNLTQGIIGRILGYGKLVIRGTGMGDVTLPNIDDPLEFRKKVLTTKDG